VKRDAICINTRKLDVLKRSKTLCFVYWIESGVDEQH